MQPTTHQLSTGTDEFPRNIKHCTAERCEVLHRTAAPLTDNDQLAVKDRPRRRFNERSGQAA
jgi:hypothetical protein